MAWATYQLKGGENDQDRVGFVRDGTVFGLKGASRLVDLLGDDGSRLRRAAETAQQDPLETLPLSEVRLRPVLPEPPSIRDFSSFLDHYRAGIKAVGQTFNKRLLELPIFYYTNNTNMVADGDVISIPGQAQHMDYELEVACIIGKPGIDIDPADAEQHIAGYTIMNDWSMRDLLREELGRAPFVAKGKDAGMGLGPVMVTPEEIEAYRKGNGFDLAMISSVNGKQYSAGNWSSVDWSFSEMISYASRNVWLRTGDVIGAGTVSGGCLLELGATHGHERFPWLKAGDVVTLEIERIGTMTNTLRRGANPPPLRPREDKEST